MNLDTPRGRLPGSLIRTAAAVVFATALAIPAASAQEPRVVTVVVPYPAGGLGDILPRAMADVLAQQTGRTFVVDNKPGATQMIGARIAANAKPDGATIFFGSVTSLAINPSIKKDLPYDPAKDFEPIALTFVSPQYLIARRGLAPNSMRELTELARREPGRLNYASIGPGSSVHLAAELLKMLAGIDMTHVPYTGSGPAVRDTIAGHVDLTFTAGGMTYADQVKVLGVTSATRSPAAPQVPAIAETVPGYEATIWFGFLAPAGTPKDSVERLAREMKTAVDSGALRDRLRAAATEVDLVAMMPEEFRAYIRKETGHWRGVIKAANIPME
jgi:tripartite-type tricarboxylate transporter receptor subunit TctC